MDGEIMCEFDAVRYGYPFNSARGINPLGFYWVMRKIKGLRLNSFFELQSKNTKQSFSEQTG